MEHFTAGNIKNHFVTWKSITSNDFILNVVKNGLTIGFVDIAIAPHPHIRTFSDEEITAIENEISNLISKNVITQVEWSEDNFVSGVFTVDKKDGGFRMILNLKQLNESVKYEHFKMETLEDVLNLLNRMCGWAALTSHTIAFLYIQIFKNIYLLLEGYLLSVCSLAQWFRSCCQSFSLRL